MSERRSRIANTVKLIIEALEKLPDDEVYIILKSVLFMTDFNDLKKQEKKE